MASGFNHPPALQAHRSGHPSPLGVIISHRLNPLARILQDRRCQRGVVPCPHAQRTRRDARVLQEVLALHMQRVTAWQHRDLPQRIKQELGADGTRLPKIVPYALMIGLEVYRYAAAAAVAMEEPSVVANSANTTRFAMPLPLCCVVIKQVAFEARICAEHCATLHARGCSWLSCIAHHAEHLLDAVPVQNMPLVRLLLLAVLDLIVTMTTPEKFFTAGRKKLALALVVLATEALRAGHHGDLRKRSPVGPAANTTQAKCQQRLQLRIEKLQRSW
eukprot:TRINITY_DN6864_c3_g1_i1.p1 TRINITY_DN6864_c3_g1~~TRINITY_DN6864_c3_g1_i1.p1  ORF type:complete len:275 (+),score=12.85 TRINITY_DN6864_c3_g1_i1:601-1425(+)